MLSRRARTALGRLGKSAKGSKILLSVNGHGEWFTADGRNMEGWGVPPDFLVREKHEDLHAGRDAQLERAIELLLAQLDGKLSPPKKPGAGLRTPESSGK